MDDIFKQQYLAIRRAEHRLKQRLETIAFEKDLKEELEQLKEGAIRGKLPKIVLDK